LRVLVIGPLDALQVKTRAVPGQCQRPIHQNGAGGAPLGRRGLVIVPKTRLCKMDLPPWFDGSEDELKTRKFIRPTPRVQAPFVPRVTMQSLLCRKAAGAALLWNAMTKVKLSYLLGKYF